MKTITLNVRNFPEDLNRTLKAEAATRGKSLQDFVIELLRDATKKGGK